MKVLITGPSKGIGRETALLFLDRGFDVIGFDRLEPTIDNPNYHHYKIDIREQTFIDECKDIDILINNAGTQNEDDIDINLKGTINITEKYGIQPNIKAIVNVASASAHSGAEFPEYSASKGGLLAYTKNVALRIAKYGATCNSISPGGVLTELNEQVIVDKDKWQQIMDLTLIPKWADASEIAEWIYFIAIVNKSMTAQDILIDNGEMANQKFIW